MPKPTILSETARTVLTSAAARGDRAAFPPERLPVAAQRAVVKSLLNAGLLEEVPADENQPAGRTAEDGTRVALWVTDAGVRAVGLEPPSSPPNSAQGGPLVADNAQPAPQSPEPSTAAQGPLVSRRARLRAAAVALLAAWDDADDSRPGLPDAVAALHAALVRPTRPQPAAPRSPRASTKRAVVLGLLRRPEGTTVAQVVEATGWARHTVHGFLAGLKKSGTPVEMLERVRQAGPGKQGAAGSYTVYRVVEAG